MSKRQQIHAQPCRILRIKYWPIYSVKKKNQMRIPRIYSSQNLASESEITLEEKASHHILKVLRMQVGRQLIVFNGDAGEFPATIVAIDKKKARIKTQQRSTGIPESLLESHLVIGISKGDRFDWVLQKATELGVTHITPLLSERCEIKLTGERKDKKILSWKNIIISACEQCQRNTLPSFNNPISFSQYMQSVEDNKDELKVVLHHRTQQKLTEYASPQRVCLLVGPEGGLSDHEIEQAEAKGFNPLALGPRVLRTETAPIVALSALQLLWGDL